MIAVQIGPYNLFGYRRCEKVSFVLEEQNQISKCDDTRANYKHLSVLSSDVPLGLCEYPVSDALMGLYGLLSSITSRDSFSAIKGLMGA